MKSVKLLLLVSLIGTSYSIFSMDLKGWWAKATQGTVQQQQNPTQRLQAIINRLVMPRDENINNLFAQVRAAIEAGADPNIGDSLNRRNELTALMLAIQYERSADVAFLLAHGANPNRAMLNGALPLIEAVEVGNINIIGSLLAAGANINQSDKLFGDTALITAVQHAAANDNALKIINLLLKHSADRNIINNDGETALDVAIRLNLLQIIPLLGKQKIL